MILDKTKKRKMALTLFVLPALTIHLLIVTLPASTLLFYSFTEWSGMGKAVYNGLDNFVTFFRDRDFHTALLRNIIYMMIFLTAPVVTGLIFAFILIRLKRSQMIFRTLFFLPFVVSPVVASKVFSYFYSPGIGVARLFKSLGIKALEGFAPLGSTKLALFAIAFIDYWHWWGFVAALMISALSQVNPDLHESALIEGASRLRMFWQVTLPQIMPTILTLYMITIIGSFLTFDWIYVTTQGGPAGSTHVASTIIYQLSFRYFRAGYGSALSFVICSICVVVYFLFKFLSRKQAQDL